MSKPTLLEVGFSRLRVNCKIGAYKGERRKSQRIYVSVKLGYPSSKGEHAGYSDQLEDAIDYAHAAEIVRRVCKEKHHDLLEHLAARIDTAFTHEIHGWTAVEILIEKPEALTDAKASICRWVRSQDQPT